MKKEDKIMIGYLALFLLILTIAAHIRIDTLEAIISENTPPELSAQTTVTPELEEPEEPPKIRYALTIEERDLVERVVMAESGNQPLEGQMAVAQCVLNTAEETDQRPDAVVLAKDQYATPAPSGSVTDSVKQAVSAVFDHGEVVTYEPIRYFYAPKYSSGAWHESSLVHVTTIADHKFFRAP